ncbi:MAG: carbohydrate kinase family protein [Desulfovibrio sp.]|nr:carbohydrate kinase family protein [Desulfovibrio sp.]
MAIYVSGSIATDRIMTFAGNFHDHLVADKLRSINVSFMVDGMEERRGGCAGNIAYSLALLGEKAIIISCVGRDFGPYGEALQSMGLSLEGIRRCDDLYTAQCFITTDLNSNQLTGFYPGAMFRPADYGFEGLDPKNDIAIISPGNIDDMRRLCAFYKAKGVRYIYDPGQQLPVLTAEDLLGAINGSFACITNDYEISLISQKTGKSPEELARGTQWLVTTLGAEGADVRGADGTQIRVPIVPVGKVVDPTGAGDAQRAGLIKGLVRGLDLPEAARLGAVSASFAIEKMGTQEHRYSIMEFRSRYEAVFGTVPAGVFDESE